MKRTLSLIPVLALALLSSAIWHAQTNASETEQDQETIALFNGENLDGWHIYVDDDSVDPKEVWQVKDGAIWCKGEPFGFLRTTQEFTDFKLTLEWKWVDEPTNSGVLLRMTDEDKIWPLCMEAQLMHQRAGDVVGMGCDFNENEREEGEFFRVATKQHESNEKDPGAWNSYEIICQDDTMKLTVNGLHQNTATGICVDKGFIGLQSEGSPIMFRNIMLTPLN